MQDRTCNHCGKRLTFFLKLSGDGKFCSSAHRKLYQEEMERLALESLFRSELVTRQRMAEPNPSTPPPEPQPPVQIAETPDAPVPPLGDIVTCHPTSHPPAALRRRTFGIMIRIGTMVPESEAREQSPQGLALGSLVPLAITLLTIPPATHSVDCTGLLHDSAMAYPNRGRATTGPSPGGMSGVAGLVPLPILAAWSKGVIAIGTARRQGGVAPAMVWPRASGLAGGKGLTRAGYVPLPPLRSAAPIQPAVPHAANASFPIPGAMPSGCSSVRSGGLPEAACLPIPVAPQNGRIPIEAGPSPFDRPYTLANAIPRCGTVRAGGAPSAASVPISVRQRTGSPLVTTGRLLPVEWPYAPALPGTIPGYCYSPIRTVRSPPPGAGVEQRP